MHAIWISGTNFIVKHFFLFPLGFGSFRRVPRENMWKYEPILSFHEVILEKNNNNNNHLREKWGLSFRISLASKTSKCFVGCRQPMYVRARERKCEGTQGSDREARGGLRVRFPFCAGVQFSRDSIRTFNDRIKTRGKREL